MNNVLHFSRVLKLRRSFRAATLDFDIHLEWRDNDAMVSVHLSNM